MLDTVRNKADDEGRGRETERERVLKAILRILCNRKPLKKFMLKPEGSF